MENLKDYIVYFNGILNLAVLGFIIRFSLMTKNAFKEKEDILLKRIDSIKDDLNRTEIWAGRKEEDLIRERDSLKSQLDKILVDAKVDLASYDLLNAVEKINSEFKESLKEISKKVELIVSMPKLGNHELYISMAKAYASNGEWFKAAQQYDLVTKDITDNWELYFYKGIAYANSRIGNESDLKALKAYSDAITYSNEVTDSEKNSRLFIYRGAMLKRLHRLEEALSDIKIGLSRANSQYEIDDGLYNLACIYAMQNDKESFNETANQLKYRNDKKYNYLLSRCKKYAPDFKI